MNRTIDDLWYVRMPFILFLVQGVVILMLTLNRKDSDAHWLLQMPVVVVVMVFLVLASLSYGHVTHRTATHDLPMIRTVAAVLWALAAGAAWICVALLAG